MECQAILLWSFTRLVGAYLDLGIAFLLLCGSTLAYAASRFLAYFGMSLPCPCNGMFGEPGKDHCLQEFLVEHPTHNISVKSKFPCSWVWSKDIDTVIEGLMAKGDGYFGGKQDNLMGERFCISAKDESFEDEGVSKKGRSKPKEWSRSKKRCRLSCLRLSSSASNGLVISTVQDSVSANQEIASHGVLPVAFPMVGDSKGVHNVSFAQGSSSKCFSSDKVFNEIKSNNEDIPTFQERGNKEEESQEVTHVEETAVRLLEQALEEERSAHAALYSELEKERSAAASAADEAMAMILRLQEEKAIVEMSARQYRRMVEEKSVFDAKEMNLLKEILLQRERETHFLQMEVEAYWQMAAGNVHWLGVSQTELPDIKMNDLAAEQGDNANDNKSNAAYFERVEVGASRAREEVIVSIDTIVHGQNVKKKSSVVPSIVEEPGSPESSAFPEDTIIPTRDMQEHKDQISLLGEVIQTVKNEIIEDNSDGCGHVRCDPEPHVYDVHVVDSRPNMSVNLRTYENKHGPEKISMRRNSMSAIDWERLRIESEVGLLRQKIRIVQEGREKLNGYLDQKEREKIQLQVLDDMAIQLQEIRNLTSPGSVARQSSLPPQSSKWMPKERRHQSSSRGLTKKEFFKKA